MCPTVGLINNERLNKTVSACPVVFDDVCNDMAKCLSVQCSYYYERDS